jgi:hypothetical protein
MKGDELAPPFIIRILEVADAKGNGFTFFISTIINGLAFIVCINTLLLNGWIIIT